MVQRASASGSGVGAGVGATSDSCAGVGAAGYVGSDASVAQAEKRAHRSANVSTRINLLLKTISDTFLCIPNNIATD